MEQRISVQQAQAIHYRLGQLLQAGRHETAAETNRRMAEETYPHGLLEAVEEN